MVFQVETIQNSKYYTLSSITCISSYLLLGLLLYDSYSMTLTIWVSKIGSRLGPCNKPLYYVDGHIFSYLKLLFLELPPELLQDQNLSVTLCTIHDDIGTVRGPLSLFANGQIAQFTQLCTSSPPKYLSSNIVEVPRNVCCCIKVSRPPLIPLHHSRLLLGDMVI